MPLRAFAVAACLLLLAAGSPSSSAFSRARIRLADMRGIWLGRVYDNSGMGLVWAYTRLRLDAAGKGCFAIVDNTHRLSEYRVVGAEVSGPDAVLTLRTRAGQPVALRLSVSRAPEGLWGTFGQQGLLGDTIHFDPVTAGTARTDTAQAATAALRRAKCR